MTERINGILHFGKGKPYPGKEDNLQKSVARYLSYHNTKPLFFHVPNGGYRNGVEAAIFKGMGVLPGVADTIVMHPKFQYHGFIAELKRKGGKMQPSQIDFLTKAAGQGYAVCACWNLDGFMMAWTRYLLGDRLVDFSVHID